MPRKADGLDPKRIDAGRWARSRPAGPPNAEGTKTAPLFGWRILAVAAIGLGLLALRACERYTSEYQTLPAVDWFESRPPLAESADVPSALDLARGAARVLPLLDIRDDARPYLPGLGPPSLSRRTIGGVRDAAMIQVGTPEVPRPRLQVTLRVTVFYRSARAAAWNSLLDHEFDLRDPGTGTAQLRLTGADDPDRVWITHPGESPGGEATVVGARGPVVFELQALAQRPDSLGDLSQPEALDLSARAERIARQAAADWTAWLLPQLSPSRA
jgi:hypothetical protein